jgi:hypothetical protein
VRGCLLRRVLRISILYDKTVQQEKMKTKNRLYHRKRRIDNTEVRKRRQNGFASLQNYRIDSFLSGHKLKTYGAYGNPKK